MKVRIIKSCVAANAVHAVGEILDLENQEARQLLALARAVPHADAPMPSMGATLAEPEELEEPKAKSKRK